MNVPSLLQIDARWKGQRLGTNNACTIGSDGCAVTCMAMKNLYYGGTGMPNNIDDIFTTQGAYVDGAGHRSPNSLGCSELDWSRINACLPRVNHVATGFYDNAPADLDRIKASIDQGHPVTLQVNWLGHANAMHFVEAYAYSGNDIIVNCPERGPGIHFSSKDYGTGDAAKDILRAHFFTGPVPAQPGRGAVAPAQVTPAAAPAHNPEDEPMTDAQEQQAYQIVLGRAREGAPTGRTAMQFILDAQNEESADRQHVADLNTEVTELTGKLNEATSLASTQGATITNLTKELSDNVPAYSHTFVDGPPVEMLTKEAVTVVDFAGQQAPVELPPNTIVEVEGTFSMGGVAYLRTQKSVAGGYFYGVSADSVAPYTPAPGALSTTSAKAALSTSQSIHAMAADGMNGWQRFFSKLNPFGGKK